jgi:hypothetical protein
MRVLELLAPFCCCPGRGGGVVILSQACCSIVTRPKQLGAGLAVLECCRTLVFLFRNDNGPRLSLRQGWGVPQFKKNVLSPI